MVKLPLRNEIILSRLLELETCCVSIRKDTLFRQGFGCWKGDCRRKYKYKRSTLEENNRKEHGTERSMGKRENCTVNQVFR